MITELIYVAIVPFAVAATAALIAWQMRFTPPVVWAVAVGLGYVAAQLALAGRAGAAGAFASLVAPREAVEWLPYAVLFALGLTILATYAPRTWRRLVIILAVMLSIGLPLRLLANSDYSVRWSLLEKLAYISLLSATLGLTWLVLAAARRTEQPRLRPLLLIAVAAGSAVVVALSGVFVYGELCGAVAAALAGAAVASRAWQLEGAAGVVTFSLGSLIVLSCFYAELTTSNAALLFLAMMMAAGRLPEHVSARPAWQQVALRTGLTLLPLAVALAQALAAAQAEMSSNPYAI
jgi:hypothetical protein